MIHFWMNLDGLNIKTYGVGHLPLVRAVLDQLAIVEVTNELCPLHPQSRVSDADCVAAMILNILSGRMALFRMEKWLRRSDTELLLGEGCDPDAFNDTRLAVALDHLDAVGTDTILGAVVERYLDHEHRPTTYSVHTDTTSFSLHGAYEEETDPNVTFGYSKAKRPDLKQLIFGLSLHGAVGIPLVATVTSGNTPEQTSNRDHLARLSRLLPDSDDVTIVADCKIVDADSIGRVLCSGFHLVSLVPDTFSLRSKLIEEAWQLQEDVESWPELARQPGRTKAAPPKVYRGWSVTRTFKVLLRKNGDVANEPLLSFEELRFLVVHSTMLAARFEKSLPGKLNKEREWLEEFRRKVALKGFACEADALKAAEEVAHKVKLHHVGVQAYPEICTLKRKKRGRPRNGEEAPTETRWGSPVRCRHR